MVKKMVEYMFMYIGLCALLWSVLKVVKQLFEAWF